MKGGVAHAVSNNMWDGAKVLLPLLSTLNEGKGSSSVCVIHSMSPPPPYCMPPSLHAASISLTLTKFLIFVYESHFTIIFVYESHFKIIKLIINQTQYYILIGIHDY